MEYLEKRQQLQREVESLRPVDLDDLVEAADLLEHFRAYWDQCREVDDPARARQQLVAKIVERVFVDGDHILALVIHGNFAVVLGQNQTTSAEIADAVRGELVNQGVTDLLVVLQCGADGLGNHTNYWLLVPRNDYRSRVRWLLDAVPFARPFVHGPSLPTAAKMVLAKGRN